ncbi:MAG: serine hydrolase domain-containing protein [Polyangiaceae bacterium]
MTRKTSSATTTRRLHDVLGAHVARGALPGLVWLVSQGDELHVEAIGALCRGGADPMRRDTIFRISSMTKLMAAAVAMMLIEDATISLDAPIERWLPELAGRRVLKRLDGPLDDTVPAKRAITVRDLFTLRMGIGIVWGPPDALPIQRAAEGLHLGAMGAPKPQGPPPPDEWMSRFATLPLMEQPGECWRYNTSTDILGVLLARASGQPLELLLRERLFAPLGMKDTGFSVPPGEVKRLATSYFANPHTGALDLYDEPAGGEWSRPPAFPSAAGGLVSTVDDCLAFARMMKAGGSLGKVRLLSETSVEAMTTDQIPAAQKAASPSSLDPTFWDTHGWGLGVAIVTDREADGPSGFGWDGGLGTSMWWDPHEDRIAILMTQRAEYPKTSRLYRDFWNAANGGGPNRRP